VKVHFEVLGWLHVSAGSLAVLTGASLAVLSAGTAAALSGLQASQTLSPSPAWLLAAAAVTFAAVGAVMLLVGRALLNRRRAGRTAALALAVPSVVVPPFGTALAIYTVWTLLNDDARREYGG
jgi:hypothetical protein